MARSFFSLLRLLISVYASLIMLKEICAGYFLHVCILFFLFVYDFTLFDTFEPQILKIQAYLSLLIFTHTFCFQSLRCSNAFICYDHVVIFLCVLCVLSGFFYSLFSRHKTGAVGEQGVSLSLPEGLDAGSVALLLDFMYTSHLPLSPGTAPGVLAAATYLQMEHVADTCRAFLQKR